MLKFFKILFFLWIIVWWYFYIWYVNFWNKVLFSEDTIFEVQSGDTYRKILPELTWDEALSWIFIRQNKEGLQNLQKWEYFIPAGTTLENLFWYLERPLYDETSLTILEWWNIFDIDRMLTSAELINAWEFIDYTTNCELFCTHKEDFAFIADAETLEGFLYPDTYAINLNTFTLADLVNRMLRNFQAKVIDTGIITNMGSIEILDVINMASIVQKEVSFTGKTDAEIYQEASKVAGILLKRHREWWYIGADATVCYPHWLPTQDCTPREVVQYLYDRNEYNTRQMVWMPRGPIANPERRIIEATVNPTESEYYYYLHAPDWQIHYAITNAWHEENKRRYLR